MQDIAFFIVVSFGVLLVLKWVFSPSFSIRIAVIICWVLVVSAFALVKLDVFGSHSDECPSEKSYRGEPDWVTDATSVVRCQD
jgi:hypothetical protein